MLLGKLVARVLRVRIGLGMPCWKVEKRSLVLLINTLIGVPLVITLEILEI